MRNPRSQIIAAAALALWGLVAGCDGGGIEEGTPKTIPASTAPAGFEEMQKNMGKNMMNPNAK